MTNSTKALGSKPVLAVLIRGALAPHMGGTLELFSTTCDMEKLRGKRGALYLTSHWAEGTLDMPSDAPIGPADLLEVQTADEAAVVRLLSGTALWCDPETPESLVCCRVGPGRLTRWVGVRWRFEGVGTPELLPGKTWTWDK